MIFLYILLAISIVGVFSLPLLRIMKPNSNIEGDREFSKDDLHRNLNNVKNLTLEKARNIGQDLGKNFKAVYDEGVSKIKSTKVSGLVQGRGVLKQKEMASKFLKDVKEHKDRIREELTNGTNIEEEVPTEVPKIGSGIEEDKVE